MENTEIITVINATGERVDLELIDVFDMDGNNYVIVGPMESDEAYAYKSSVKNGETEYFLIEQGEEFKRVLKKYNEKR